MRHGWKDISTFSQHDTKRVPHTWERVAGRVRLILCTEHIYSRGTWASRVQPFDSEPQFLKPVAEMTFDEAASYCEGRALVLVTAAAAGLENP